MLFQTYMWNKRHSDVCNFYHDPFEIKHAKKETEIDSRRKAAAKQILSMEYETIADDYNMVALYSIVFYRKRAFVDFLKMKG